MAHRISYEYFVGPMEYEIDHLCRVRRCVRPEHLEDVSHLVNMGRGDNVAQGSHNRGKTQCPKNHEYTFDNTRIDMYNKRHCKICSKQSNFDRRERSKRSAF